MTTAQAVAEAKLVLRIDASNTANDEYIGDLVDGLPTYIEEATGLTSTEQDSEPLVKTLRAFLITLWYYADHSEDQKLQRTIDNLLKVLTTKANELHRAGAAN